MKTKFTSMRLRLTLLTTAITTIACLVLTTGNMASLGTQFTKEKIIPATLLEIPSKLVDDREQQPPMQDVMPPVMTTPSIAIEAQTLLDSAKQEYKTQSLFVTFFIVTASSMLTYFLVGNFMRPIDDFVGTVQKMDEDNLSIRLGETAEYGELAKLSEAFNSMAERLENSFEYKKQFIANAAHELKTPLASLQTNLEVFEMKKNHTPQEYERLIEITKRQTDRLVRLSQELLELNQPEEKDMQDYPVKKSIMAIVNELQHSAKAKELTVGVSFQEFTIKGYPTLLNRLFTNLIDNSIKYSNSGGIVEITETHTVDSIVISVSDSGTGIPLEERDKVFEPFYRVDKSRSRKVGGVGLGLALCKMAAEKHDASINIADNDHGGAVISVSFPR